MDFLKDLENGTYCEHPTEKELKQQDKQSKTKHKEQERQMLLMEKITQKKAKQEDDQPIGVERMRLIIRINKYKELFPDETKSFKLKKNATVEDLQENIKELELMSESGGMDSFMNDMILECIKGTEQLSTYTENYNLTGLSALLKSNKKFNTLCKQLQLKYNLFINVPAEIQLILIVSTTAVLCMNKNKNKASLTSYLDEPYVPKEKDIVL